MQITIRDIINHLSQIIHDCSASGNKTGYFAALYKRMTAAVLENITAGNFEDADRMERLDIVFAQRYLKAYSAYFSNNPCSHSWRNVFDASKDHSLIVLQHLILGINTHINLDLAIAAAEVAPGDAIHALRNDFYKINSLISSLIDDIQECLSEVWLPMRILTKIANGHQIPVLNFSIDRARDASWANALLLAYMQENQKNMYIAKVDSVVCNLSKKIQSPGFTLRMMLHVIRASEYDDVARTIHLIDTTVVE